jgi:hypothetical protein
MIEGPGHGRSRAEMRPDRHSSARRDQQPQRNSPDARRGHPLPDTHRRLRWAGRTLSG